MEDAPLGPAQRTGGIEHLRVQGLERAQRGTVDQWKRDDNRRDHRSAPREHQRDAVVDKPSAHSGGLAKDHQQQKAAYGGRQHHGMVKTESSTPLMRLVVPMVRQAASSPSANETASATPAVLIDTHSGR